MFCINFFHVIIQEEGLLASGRETERGNICVFVLMNSAVESFEPVSSMDFLKDRFHEQLYQASIQNYL